LVEASAHRRLTSQPGTGRWRIPAAGVFPRPVQGCCPMSRNATPDQPVVRFATKKGRRTFLYFGSIAFVVCCFGMIVLGLYLIRQDPLAELRAWTILVIGMIGVPFFGLIAFGIGRNHWGRQGDTSLILTPEGLIDRTQIVGALPVVPW